MEKFLETHPLLKRTSNGRIICNATFHEMPANLATLQHYVAGHRYARGKRMYDILHKYEQFLKDNGQEYYCLLTNKLVAKTPESLGSHVAGKRFKKTLAKYEITGVLPDYRDRDRLAPKPEEPTIVRMPVDIVNDGAIDVDALGAMVDSSENEDDDDDSDVEGGESSGENDVNNEEVDNESDYDFDIMMDESGGNDNTDSSTKKREKRGRPGGNLGGEGDGLIEDIKSETMEDCADAITQNGDVIVGEKKKKGKRKIKPAVEEVEMDVSIGESVENVPTKKKRKRQSVA